MRPTPIDAPAVIRHFLKQAHRNSLILLSLCCGFSHTAQFHPFVLVGRILLQCKLTLAWRSLGHPFSVLGRSSRSAYSESESEAETSAGMSSPSSQAAGAAVLHAPATGLVTYLAIYIPPHVRAAVTLHTLVALRAQQCGDGDSGRLLVQGEAAPPLTHRRHHATTAAAAALEAGSVQSVA